MEDTVYVFVAVCRLRTPRVVCVVDQLKRADVPLLFFVVVGKSCINNNTIHVDWVLWRVKFVKSRVGDLEKVRTEENLPFYVLAFNRVGLRVFRISLSALIYYLFILKQ